MVTFPAVLYILNVLTSQFVLGYLIIIGIILYRLYKLEQEFIKLKEYQLTSTVSLYLLIKKLQEKQILTDEDITINSDKHGKIS
jgi:hypothetical protein